MALPCGLKRFAYRQFSSLRSQMPFLPLSLSSFSFTRSTFCFPLCIYATMHATPNPEQLPYMLLSKAGLPSDTVVDLEDSIRLQKSNHDIYRSGPDIQNPPISNPTTNGTKDATLKSITNSSTHKQPEQTLPPLRLALARRSVKQQIFTYMDQGDKKTDIESRTGLSHNCIKWHRRLWRDECSHPRPKKLSRSLARGLRSSGTRSERSLGRRPACDENGKFVGVGGSGGEKVRRKRRARKWLEQCYVGRGVEVYGARGNGCAERETTESG